MLNVRPKSQKIKVYTNPVLSYDPAMTDVKKKNLKTVFKNICVICLSKKKLYHKPEYSIQKQIAFNHNYFERCERFI